VVELVIKEIMVVKKDLNCFLTQQYQVEEVVHHKLEVIVITLVQMVLSLVVMVVRK
jgi:hypothetical protein